MACDVGMAGGLVDTVARQACTIIGETLFCDDQKNQFIIVYWKNLFGISDVIKISAIVPKSPHSTVLFQGLVETACRLQTQLRQLLYQKNVSVYSTAKTTAVWEDSLQHIAVKEY